MLALAWNFSLYQMKLSSQNLLLTGQCRVKVPPMYAYIIGKTDLELFSAF